MELFLLADGFGVKFHLLAKIPGDDGVDEGSEGGDDGQLWLAVYQTNPDKAASDGSSPED